MTCGDFIGNLEGLNEGGDFPRELLKVGGRAGYRLLEGRDGGPIGVPGEVKGLLAPAPAEGASTLSPLSRDSVWGTTPSLQPHTPALQVHAHSCAVWLHSNGREVVLENT